MGLKVKAIERNVSFVKDGEPGMTVFLKTLTIIRFFSQILPFSKKEV